MTKEETNGLKTNAHNAEDLAQMQALPLEAKIIMTKQRIKVWYEAWKRFEIYDDVTNKTRFVTIDTRNGEEPALKENEWIREAVDGQVYVSFSGGKDSTVLLHLVRQDFPNVEAVFVNTGLEYPEIQRFVKTFDRVTILRPSMRFDEVIRKYGYPIISKEVSECVSQARKSLQRQDGKCSYRLLRLQGKLLNKNGEKSIFNHEKYEPLLHTDFVASNKCCAIMKKHPAKQYAKKTGKKPITAQMASESKLRKQQWVKNGCNGFDMKSPISNPMSFWTEQDVLEYIKINNLPIASVYGDIVEEDSCGCEYETNLLEEKVGKYKTTGCDRTGCIFCGFGCHLDKEPSRFQMLKETHPKQYNYCLNGGEYVDGVWQPNKQGLGMKHVFEELNKIYGEDFIKF